VADDARESVFSDDFVEYMRDVVSDSLDPDKAIRVQTLLLGECVDADKEKLDQIKCMDKLINSCRHMFEHKMKTEEAAAADRKIDELETMVEERPDKAEPA
jgi:hypothetical protein